MRFLCPQFAMVSGRSPFLSASKSVSGREDNASSIMRRIKAGDCKIDKESGFSPPAKALVKGLLTVDPKVSDLASY